MPAKKSTTPKKPTKSAQETLRESARSEAVARNKKKRQMYSVILFAAGLLVISFSLLSDVAPAWDAIHNFLRGIFGLSVFFVGPILIYTSIMIARDKRKSAVVIKTLQLGAIILLACAGVHIIAFGEFGSIVEVFDAGTGGGVIGMILGVPLTSLFGRIGGSIIIILLAFVFVMVMANITLDTFLAFMGKPVKKACELAKEQRELHRQEVEYLEENRKKCEEQAAIARLTGEQASINKEISSDIKFAAIMAVADSAAKEAQAEPAPEIELPFADSPPAYVPPPVYISPADNRDSPPFDIPAEESDPFEAAVENFKQEEADEELEKQMRESSIEVEHAADYSDFEETLSMADYAEQYSLPSVHLLDETVQRRPESDIQAEQDANSEKLIETLKSFGVITKLVGVIRGPSVTRYEIQPAPGVKISKITSLTDDIALNLAAAGVRMEAPIPGKSAVGVEVPNTTVDTVTFRELIDSKDFRETGSNLRAVIGKAISGEIIISDISKMPHLLIAGTTGSGKSVCVNSIIMSILYRATPVDVRLIMIDPKSVEFMIYRGIPHLLTPVVTDPKKAAGALGWAVGEMTNRYTLFAENNVRDIDGYNEAAKINDELEPMAKIVIFIDELADLMMTAAREVEGNICRLAQMARAAGIHLVIATQRPTVNVVTGLIKANIPSRIALKVASQIDSRTIIDTAGADKLLGKGDMLYAPVGMPKPVRVQGCWVSDKEIDRVTAFIKDNFDLTYDENVIEEIERQAAAVGEKDKGGDSGEEFDMDDDKLEDAIEAVIDAGKASTSYLQLKLKLGYGRAARMIDIMEKMGIVGKFEGSKPREVLMTRQDWLERKVHMK
jgi:S-DNA-T family DNA segregation ATPase FtsK/SpoIIIE